MNINDLIKKAHDTAVAHGWWDTDRNFGEQIALMHSELSEALEEYRNRHGFSTVYYSGGGFISNHPTEGCRKPEGIPVELADVLIRIFDTCGRYGIDLEEALKIKMEYNDTRPYKHGGKMA